MISVTMSIAAASEEGLISTGVVLGSGCNSERAESIGHRSWHSAAGSKHKGMQLEPSRERSRRLDTFDGYAAKVNRSLAGEDSIAPLTA